LKVNWEAIDQDHEGHASSKTISLVRLPSWRTVEAAPLALGTIGITGPILYEPAIECYRKYSQWRNHEYYVQQIGKVNGLMACRPPEAQPNPTLHSPFSALILRIPLQFLPVDVVAAGKE
jgi:hypothetical protein